MEEARRASVRISRRENDRNSNQLMSVVLRGAGKTLVGSSMVVVGMVSGSEVQDGVRIGSRWVLIDGDFWQCYGVRRTRNAMRIGTNPWPTMQFE